MLFISTKLFDINGDFQFKEHTFEHLDINRRVTRTKTLDENVYIDDSGLTVGDNKLVCYYTGSDFETFHSVFSNHSEFLAICEDKAYNVKLFSVVYAEEIEITFYIESLAE